PLGAIGEIDVRTACLLQLAAETIGHPWKHGAAQDQQLPGPSVTEKLRDRTVKLSYRRIEVFVDGRTDGDDDSAGIFQHRGVGRRLESTRGDEISKQRIGSIFVKRHPTGIDLGYDGGIRIEQVDLMTLGSERQPEWESHVAAAADDGERPDVERHDRGT